MDIAYEGDESGCDDEADARDVHEAGDRGRLRGECGELGLDQLDAPFKLADFGAEFGERRANRSGSSLSASSSKGGRRTPIRPPGVK